MKEKIVEEIYNILNKEVEPTDIIVEKPKDRKLGDYSIPCFSLAKKLRKNPNIIAEEISKKLSLKSEVLNGYLNVFIDKNSFTKELLEKISIEKENYGSNKSGEGKTIVIDYSSPNIAKPFGVGHLRSTVIGESLRRICLMNGYNVVGINHLGDWGTQFGKLIYAYKTWGNEEALNESPLDELKRIYVKFHEEEAKDSSITDEGRKWFKALEDGNEEAVSLWKRFTEVSLKEFNKTYKLLGVDKFDSYAGESFYNDKMDSVVEELEQKHLLEVDDGASIVRLDNMPPALIKRSDGATLYITRDLAALFYRKKTYNFTEALYCVGNEQTLHFNQLNAVVEKMGYDFRATHIGFGMVLQDGKKMSTRHGKSVKLQDVLEEAIELAGKYIEEKNPNLENKKEVAEKVGVGAVIFNDLKNYRTSDIEFNLEEILKFEGNTGPYIQYTYARINSLLKNKEIKEIDYTNLDIDEYIWNIVLDLYNYFDIISRAKKEYDPSIIAKYLIDLAQDFNKFYANHRVGDDSFKLKLCESVGIVVKSGMRLLDVEVINQM
ncbi:MAG: arginine--tRNA ligase [Bacillales bacterium]|nr:arginine--tRNA ligase [Bacillales bacterium]